MATLEAHAMRACHVMLVNATKTYCTYVAGDLFQEYLITEDLKTAMSLNFPDQEKAEKLIDSVRAQVASAPEKINVFMKVLGRYGMEDTVKKLEEQILLLKGATTYADYVRRIPPNNQYKLDKKVDFEHHGVDRDLHEIAKNMKNWDGDIAPPLGLTPVEISDIQESIRKPQMQRVACLQKWKGKRRFNATYGVLLDLFIRTNNLECADIIVTLLGGTPADGPPSNPPPSQPSYQQGGYQNPPPPSQSSYPQQGAYAPQGGPQQGGYVPQGGPQQGGYVPQGGHQQGGYAPQGGHQQGGYAPQGGAQQGGYAPQEGAQQGGYVPQGGAQQGGYAPQGGAQQGAYAPQGGAQQGGYAPQGGAQQRGYAPQGGLQQGGYAPQGGPQRGGYAQQGGYAGPQQGGYTPQGTYAPQGGHQQGVYAPQGGPQQGGFGTLGSFGNSPQLPNTDTVTGDSSREDILEEIDGSTLKSKHHLPVKTVLEDLTPQQIHNLGLELGLHYPTLMKMPQTSIHGDMVHAWLIRSDDVQETSGEPSWRSLAKALLSQQFGGPVAIIRKKYLRTEVRGVQVRRNQDPPAIGGGLPLSLPINIAPGAEYSPVMSDGGSIVQYEACVRGRHKPELKLDFLNDITTRINPQPFHQAPQQLGYYDMTALMHGVAFIINNKVFKDKINHLTRNGTERDEYNLVQTCYFLGYRPIIFSNLDSAQILYLFETLDRQVQQSDQKAKNKVAHDSFMCCILSHGKEGAVYGSDSEPVEIKEIERLLVKNKTFKSRPKIFFIQACQGTSYGAEVQVTADSGPAAERTDLYTCLASVPGDKSFRDPSKGSWFITEVCKILCEYATCFSLHGDFQTLLNKNISNSAIYKYYEEKEKKWFSQHPVGLHQLKHHVHFFCDSNCMQPTRHF